MSVHQRTCGRCERTLPVESFSRMGDGRQHWCKACFREYFRDRGAKHLQQSGAAQVRRRAIAKAHALAYAKTRGCADCGETDPVVLEFDHVGGKVRGVAQLLCDGASLSRVQAEIERCVVVCACCHRVRTLRRRGSWRVGIASDLCRRRKPALDLVRARLAGGCVDCGRTDLPVLEFDHVGPKRSTVMTLLWTGYALDTIRREMDACVVRCANCHRRRTAAVGNHYRHAATMSGTTPP